MKLSIITINRNNAEGLCKTIESVVSQTFTDFEYIVIDGDSTDGSVDVINQFADKITYWLSEPDKGIYNAMNKGILKATGDYCLFLNSGDWLADNLVISDFCNLRYEEEIVSGNIYLSDNKIIELKTAICSKDLTYDVLLNSVVYHQSAFIKRTLFDLYGLYNEKYRIISDWEFFIKTLIVGNCTYTNFDRIIAYYDLNGISAQKGELNDLQERERISVFETLIPRVNKSYFALVSQEEMNNRINSEYDYLKNGKFGFIVRFLLWLKLKRKFNKRNCK